MIGSHVHLSSNCELYTANNAYIRIGNYVGISSHVSFYAQTDDYVGPYMSNPTVPQRFRNVSEEDVILDELVLIGPQSVVLPGVHVGEACSFGANCLINKSTPPGGVYVGSPCRRIHERDIEEIQKKARELVEEENRRRSRRVK